MPNPDSGKKSLKEYAEKDIICEKTIERSDNYLKNAGKDLSTYGVDHYTRRCTYRLQELEAKKDLDAHGYEKDLKQRLEETVAKLKKTREELIEIRHKDMSEILP